MSQEIINTGTVPNDGTGDTLRTAFEKTSNNFDELYYHHSNTTANIDLLRVAANSWSNTVGYSGNAYINLSTTSSNSYAGFMANSVNAYVARGYTTANSAYNLANDVYINVTAVYTVTNVAFATANAGYNLSNNNLVNVTAAYAVANAAFDFANDLSVIANVDQIAIRLDGISNVANAAFETSNSAYTYTNVAFTTANAGFDLANDNFINVTAAYTVANAAFTKANLNVFTSNVIITVNDSTNAALVISQTGTGHCFVIEDQASDSSPFIIDSNGSIAQGATDAIAFNFRSSKDITGPVGNAYAISVDATIKSSVTNSAKIFSAEPLMDNFMAIDSLYYFNARSLGIPPSSTINNHFGYFISDVSTAANNFGFYSNISANSGHNNWNFYASGNANNYFAGYVGIGIDVPTSSLHVVGNANVTDYLIVSGTNVAPSFISANNYAGAMANSSNNYAGYLANTVTLQVADETSNTSTYYPLFTLTTSGNVYTSNISTTKLYFVPDTGTLSATIFNSLSDITLKTDIEGFNGDVILESINPVSFKWKDTNRSSFGVIAQELEKVLPDLVETNDQGLKSVSYIPLIAVLIDSNKKLYSRLEAVEKEVEELKKKL